MRRDLSLQMVIVLMCLGFRWRPNVSNGQSHGHSTPLFSTNVYTSQQGELIYIFVLGGIITGESNTYHSGRVFLTKVTVSIWMMSKIR